jgi:hypothetical protein
VANHEILPVKTVRDCLQRAVDHLLEAARYLDTATHYEPQSDLDDELQIYWAMKASLMRDQADEILPSDRGKEGNVYLFIPGARRRG